MTTKMDKEDICLLEVGCYTCYLFYMYRPSYPPTENMQGSIKSTAHARAIKALHSMNAFYYFGTNLHM